MRISLFRDAGNIEQLTKDVQAAEDLAEPDAMETVTLGGLDVLGQLIDVSSVAK